MSNHNDIEIQDYIDETHRESLEYIRYIRERVSYIRETSIKIWNLTKSN
jgi:hypothetical protein